MLYLNQQSNIYSQHEHCVPKGENFGKRKLKLGAGVVACKAEKENWDEVIDEGQKGIHAEHKTDRPRYHHVNPARSNESSNHYPHLFKTHYMSSRQSFASDDIALPDNKCKVAKHPRSDQLHFSSLLEDPEY